MATWIAHLRIAEKLLTAIPGLRAPEFAAGSLAPDSGIPNADHTAFDPPRQVSHFTQPAGDDVVVCDLRFYRDHLSRADASATPEILSFLWGYFAHLVTDQLWFERIAVTAMAQFATLIEDKGQEAWWVMKDDWYGLDLRHVRDHPQSLFWQVFTPLPPIPDVLPFLPRPAMRSQFERIRDFYTRWDEQGPLDRPYPYLNERTMTRFVADTTAAIVTLHARLMEHSVAGPGETALGLLPGSARAPYPPPLGDPPGEA
jgi:hypothetical protein